MGSFFYNILVYPIEMIVEFVYSFFSLGFSNVGLSIAAISVVVNLLALPLYNIAESLQKKERDERQRLEPGIRRIKETFKGDEQYMMLSTYYRQNNYHPAYALRSSVSLIIQVPFFIAAYHFLSNLEQLQGQRFAFIPNLGIPDGLISLGGFTINALPILMTVINIIAGAIYTKGFPVRDKLQLYGMAGLFLILLYQSPAGLVLYWTLNNLFSLIKNIFFKFKRPLLMFYLVATLGTFALVNAMLVAHPRFLPSEKLILYAGSAFIAALPLLVFLANLLYDKFLARFADSTKQRNRLFIFSALLLFLLNGVVVPANLIVSSPIEFSFVGIVENPLSYVANTATIFFGLWVVWASFIYVVANKKMKAIISFLLSCFALIALVNLFVFKGDYGLVSRLLEFDMPHLLDADRLYTVAPFVILLVMMIISLILLHLRKAHYLTTLLTIITLASGVSGLVSCTTIQREFKAHKKNVMEAEALSGDSSGVEPFFHLSKEGKNVVFLFLDKAFSYYFPIILEQFPELQQQYEGFVYYPDTISFGGNTILGTPAMMGGYEYTLDAINARSSDKLVDKHNEAALVLPKLFLDNGYSVTITDPPYSNYKWTGDYTPFKQYPEMRVMKHKGRFSSEYKEEFSNVLNSDKAYDSTIIKKRMPIFSILKTTFPVVRRTLYKRGSYFLAFGNPPDLELFLDAYSQLYYLGELTEYDAEGNTYTFIGNDSTHEPAMLQAPKYEPQAVVTDKSTPLDAIPNIERVDIQHYHINAAALRQVGRWLEDLQEAGVYDNTRVIIVADHGFTLYSDRFENFPWSERFYGSHNPLMLFKDFDATGEWRTDDSFMTHADAPLFAIEDLGFPPINPFTGMDMKESASKESVNVYTGHDHNDFVFSHSLPSSYSVKNSLFEPDNWTRLTE